jgi:hypothetical protein
VGNVSRNRIIKTSCRKTSRNTIDSLAWPGYGNLRPVRVVDL